jgi:hypothetical protein
MEGPRSQHEEQTALSRLYLEPSTDGPAAQDWSTALILSEDRWVARWSSVFVVLLPLAVFLTVVLPRTPGNVGSIGVLGLLGLLGLIGSFMLLAERRRRRLLAQPWRRCPATVAAARQTAAFDRVIVFEEGRSLVLRGTLPDVLSVLLHRQELFLVGPDAKRRALIRVAGLCQMFPVKVDTGEARPKEREPGIPGHPPDARAFRRLRRGAYGWLYAVAVGVVGAAVLTLGLQPLSPLALVVGGVLLVVAMVTAPAAVTISRYYAKAAAAAKAATEWTSLPIMLFPWEPTNVVAGLVQLPGRTVLIQFPLPNLDVIANIADTGTIWIWGNPSEVVAVGVPQLPVVTVGVLQADRDKPPEEPQPWLLRGNDPGLSKIPALRK